MKKVPRIQVFLCPAFQVLVQICLVALSALAKKAGGWEMSKQATWTLPKTSTPALHCKNVFPMPDWTKASSNAKTSTSALLKTEAATTLVLTLLEASIAGLKSDWVFADRGFCFDNGGQHLTWLNIPGSINCRSVCQLLSSIISVWSMITRVI